MKRALITGGAGFIGLALARNLLDRGWKVDLLDNFARGARDSDLAALAARPDVTLHEADLLNDRTVAALPDIFSCVFHFAAVVGVEKVSNNPAEVLRLNTALTEAAIDVAKHQRALDRFVLASTSEVYSGALENFELPIPTPEDTPLALADMARPRTSYMLSKIYCEMLCRYSSVPFTIVRPHNIYGPRMGLAHVIPQLLQRAYETPPNTPFDVRSVDHTRTFCFIDDAVEMIVRATEIAACSGEVLNIGAQEPEITIGGLAEMVLSVIGKPLEIVPRPPTPGSPRRRAPDMSKCAKLTDYSARVGLESGIRHTFDWYRANVFESRAGSVAI